ncbi:MAG: thioesterase family protein [Planctomycetota bacterium]|nr:thioesterase family protein [Planctomycetota bacterium]
MTLQFAAMAYMHRLKVRYGETDQMGVVHHANHLAYLEEARTEYMAALGVPYGAIEAAGVGLPVRRAELRYLAPAFYEDELEVSVQLERLRSASIRFGYGIQRPADGAELLEGMIELACIDLSTRRPRHLPEDLRAQLEVEAQASS